MQPKVMLGSKRSQRSCMSGHGERAARRPERVLRKPTGSRKVDEAYATPYMRRLSHKLARRSIQAEFARMSVEFTEFLFGDGEFTPVWGIEKSPKKEKTRRSAEEHRAFCKKDRRSFYRRATRCGAVTVTATGAFFQKAI